MLKILNRKFHNHNEAWDRMIEFIAVDNCPPMLLQMDHQFEWFYEDEKLAKEIIEVYDLELIKSDKQDHLGDMYVENQSQLGRSYKGQFLTPEHVVNMMCAMTIEKTDEEINILDPCTGTGRFLMGAHEYAPNANLFGVDIDQRALRVAFTNCAIHNISAYFLHADSLMHETDISKPEGRYNWQYANRWNSCWDELKPIAHAVIDYESREDTYPRYEKPEQMKLEYF
ncbi:MAG: SAM-dependent DNA methyltransferase [Euryarchaeota archaeon]|nr:SAM-dependent DNA methyltransferase [Euryarchaeota archaeon]MBU4032949.1 N-6 DNA methylase [Candidatus Thermoplasmatota archaeon]MBU4144249.1 N-6 DNA methylase [Candidatus Thermoplasmatota archaeon]